ncbi:c-type cytochrome [uncultured Gimesia sp.]|uniref:c-type cytochrome n=1 Tax=uncultured Gimesia sp. TaxID=1678688 RepID=UPI0030DBC83F|tara:strand:- start:162824 stop:165244 length:2421 start_codon:yes stop_codon:yes gene_type:complete
MHRSLIYCWSGILLLLTGTSAYAETDAAPFVSGFDRFARHAEIEPQVGGKLLLSELSCTACHQTDRSDLAPKGGPRLTGVGNRLQQQWLQEYLTAPHAVKPGSTMPDMLQHLPAEEKRQTIAALSAFLMSQQTEFPTIKATGANPVPYEFWKKGNVERGQELYHKIGCVACHEPDETYEPGETKISPTDQMLAQLDPEDIIEMGLAAKMRPVKSVPHGDLPAKYTRKVLTFFLLNPEQTRPAGRMPQLKLKAVEAADIAAYLLRDQKTQPAENTADNDSALVAEGRKLFVQLQCVNCHAAQNLKPEQFAKPLATLNAKASTSCIGQSQKGLPHYPLDQQQQAAIQQALAHLSQKQKPEPKQQLAFQLLQLNCYACHERDKLGGVGFNRKPYFETVGRVDLGDEGRIPPTLTGIGFKLQKKWLAKVLSGKGDLRFHMQARMPVFPKSTVGSLPVNFEQADNSQKQQSDKQVFPDHGKLASSGRVMLETGCIQCHPIRGESMPGVVGTDLGDVTNRVHAQWFHEFLLDPASLKPRTRMPTFFPDGKSQNKTLFDGNVDRQIASLWSYLKAGSKQPLPEKILEAKSKNYELVPETRPIILRTFMQEAGTHAIAVGFPEKVHIAFDAEQVRPAIAWKGRFLDAQGTWFIRFAPPAIPLDKNPVLLPAGAPLALLNKPGQPWPEFSAKDNKYQFQGYRVDKGGVPTFLYRFGQYEIEDRIAPGEKQSLKRTIKIKSGPSSGAQTNLWFRGLTGKSLKRFHPATVTNQAGLTVSVANASPKTSKLREIEGELDWIIPVPAAETTTIEVTYQW